MLGQKIKLNSTNFVKEVLNNNGYFCEHFPFCFSTSSLSDKWNEIEMQIRRLVCNNGIITNPIKISISKEGLLRRDIYIPNILSFLDLLIYMGDNYDIILSKSKSKASESKINYIKSFEYPTSFKKSVIIRNVRFVGYKYKLKLDIANCFNSIYTHSLSWAFVGKNVAKAIVNRQQVPTFEYMLGDKLDKLNSKMNSNQTNGLLTGPYTSRVSSELILAELDRVLEDEGFRFVRYVDDYNFYFTTEEEAKNSITKIAQILSEYNLLLNKDKIEIIKFPFDILDNFEEIFRLNENCDNVYELLQKAYKLCENGNMGAIKYLLKVVGNKHLPSRYFEQIFGLLINTMITFPLLSPYIAKVVEIYLPYLTPYKINKRLNKLLFKEVELEHSHEVLWLLYIMMSADVIIDEKIIKEIFKQNNDLAIIMCLDYLSNRYDKSGYKSFNEVANVFNEGIKSISEKIKDSSMHSKHWLLAYVICKNNLTLNKKIKVGSFKNWKYYKLFADNDVQFYSSFY